MLSFVQFWFQSFVFFLLQCAKSSSVLQQLVETQAGTLPGLGQCFICTFVVLTEPSQEAEEILQWVAPIPRHGSHQFKAKLYLHTSMASGQSQV